MGYIMQKIKSFTDFSINEEFELKQNFTPMYHITRRFNGIVTSDKLIPGTPARVLKGLVLPGLSIFYTIVLIFQLGLFLIKN
jgi:hypothetical protein